MKIGTPKEVIEGERRVAMTPESAGQLQKLGHDCLIEAGAGALSGFDDAAYEAAGVTVVETAAALWEQADVVAKVGRYVRQHVGQTLDQCFQILAISFEFLQARSFAADLAGELGQQYPSLFALCAKFRERCLLFSVKPLEFRQLQVDGLLHDFECGQSTP